MTRRVVVGLGPVDPELVVPVLGPSVRFVPAPTPEDLAIAEGAIVRAAVDVDRLMLDRMPVLRVLARTGVGVDRIDVSAAAERGIPVTITPGSNAQAVAEGAFTMLASLIKRTGESHAYVVGGRWGSTAAPTPGDLFGTTLAVIGYGRIGRIVAGFAAAFGMEVLVHDPYVRAETHENVSLDDAVRRADAITLHLPGDGAELVTPDLLATARPGLVLVNCARASLVRTETLARALADGTLGGVGLDVFDTEPVTAAAIDTHPLVGHPGVLLSPHTTGLSERALVETMRLAAESVTAVLHGRAPAAVAPAAPRARHTPPHRHTLPPHTPASEPQTGEHS